MWAQRPEHILLHTLLSSKSTKKKKKKTMLPRSFVAKYEVRRCAYVALLAWKYWEKNEFSTPHIQISSLHVSEFPIYLCRSAFFFFWKSKKYNLIGLFPYAAHEIRIVNIVSLSLLQQRRPFVAMIMIFIRFLFLITSCVEWIEIWILVLKPKWKIVCVGFISVPVKWYRAASAIKSSWATLTQNEMNLYIRVRLCLCLRHAKFIQCLLPLANANTRSRDSRKWAHSQLYWHNENSITYSIADACLRPHSIADRLTNNNKWTNTHISK